MSEKKIVKLKDIHLYVGFTEAAADCYMAIKALRAAGVKYTLLSYADLDEHHKANFQALSTWVLGQDGHQKTVTDYPVLSWDECFDDWSTSRRLAVGLDEILDSDPLKNPELT